MTLCSACGTSLPLGSQICPSCRLPLTALAVAVPAPRRKAFPYLVGAIGLFVVLLYGLSHVQAKQHEDSHDQLLAALHGGALSTPASFQARCGVAHSQRRDDGDAVLDYGETLVYFHNASARFVRTANHLTIDEQMGMNRIPCKLTGGAD